jgi:DnaJ-class molecular chaperone
VVFVLKAQPHPVFSCEDDDLVHVAQVHLYQGLAGTAITIATLDGRCAIGCLGAEPAALLSMLE